MVLYVTGGSGSGKSLYAETRILEMGGGKRLYLATMDSGDAGSRKRIERHRAMRAGKGFTTVERARDLGALDSALLDGADVLLEDLPNLTANELFGPGGGDAARAEEAVERGLCHLRRCCRNVVIVGNEIGSDGVRWTDGMQDYLQLTARADRLAAGLADEVIEVVCGRPVRWK